MVLKLPVFSIPRFSLPQVSGGKTARTLALSILLGSGFATFFYRNSAPLVVVQTLVREAQDFLAGELGHLSRSMGHSTAGTQLIAVLLLGALVAALAESISNGAHQRRLGTAVGTLFLFLILFGHPAFSSGQRHLALQMCTAWIAANLCLGRHALWINLLVITLFGWALTWQFSEPDRPGFSHSVALATSYGVPWLGWPIGIGVGLLLASVTSRSIRVAFGTELPRGWRDVF